MQKKAVTSNSFVQNVFRGMIEPTQVFPFPVALDEEQRENLEMLVPIAERVMEEQNDPLLNDQLESVPEDTVNALRELGAFGLQVPVELDGGGGRQRPGSGNLHRRPRVHWLQGNPAGWHP